MSQEKVQFYETFFGKARNRTTMTISRSLGKLNAENLETISSTPGFRVGIDLASPK